MQTNHNLQNNKYDLEARTLMFSKHVLNLCGRLSRNQVNLKLMDQLIRSATSIGANYREANDALGKKDFVHRVRIARKEAKETNYWLELVAEFNKDPEIDKLAKECIELRNILSAIITKANV